MNTPTNNQEAILYEQWIAERGYKVTIEAPKDCERESYQTAGSLSLITESFPVFRSIPKGLPTLPAGCVIKEWFSSPTRIITVDIRPELFLDWWQQCKITTNHEYVLSVSEPQKNFHDRIYGSGSSAIESQARLAKIQAESL